MAYVWVLAFCAVFVVHTDAATVQKVAGDDIYLNVGQKTGVQIGTVFNVYRNKEVEADFGNLKFATRVFIGRIYAYKVEDDNTIARVRELPSVSELDEQKAVLKHDMAQPAFVIPVDELFKQGTEDLLNTAIPKLDQLVRFIKRFKALKVRIEVHTDDLARDANKISRKQAQSLQNWLVSEHDMNKNMLVPVGYGSQKSIATNDSEAGQRRNRRVEVIIED